MHILLDARYSFRRRAAGELRRLRSPSGRLCTGDDAALLGDACGEVMDSMSERLCSRLGGNDGLVACIRTNRLVKSFA